MYQESGHDPLSFILGISAISAAIAVLAGMAPSFTQGLAAGKAVEAVGRQPAAQGQIRTTLLIGSAMAETGGVYGFLIAFFLIFLNPFADLYVDAVLRLRG
jgi:F-type H+-transporting ATPase subunit c